MGTASRVFAIILLIVGVFLVLFIFLQGISTVQDSQGFATSRREESVECLAYSYQLENVVYENGTLTFSLHNHAQSRDITNATIIGTSRNTVPINILSGTTRNVRVDLDLQDAFSFYPTGCSVYRTECNLVSGSCEKRVDA